MIRTLSIRQKRKSGQQKENPKIFCIASSLGDGSTKLSIHESRAESHECCSNPCHKSQAHTACILEHHARRRKDATTDDDSHQHTASHAQRHPFSVLSLPPYIRNPYTPHILSQFFTKSRNENLKMCRSTSRNLDNHLIPSTKLKLRRRPSSGFELPSSSRSPPPSDALFGIKASISGDWFAISTRQSCEQIVGLISNRLATDFNTKRRKKTQKKNTIPRKFTRKTNLQNPKTTNSNSTKRALAGWKASHRQPHQRVIEPEDDPPSTATQTLYQTHSKHALSSQDPDATQPRQLQSTVNTRRLLVRITHHAMFIPATTLQSHVPSDSMAEGCSSFGSHHHAALLLAALRCRHSNIPRPNSSILPSKNWVWFFSDVQNGVSSVLLSVQPSVSDREVLRSQILYPRLRSCSSWDSFHGVFEWRDWSIAVKIGVLDILRGLHSVPSFMILTDAVLFSISVD